MSSNISGKQQKYTRISPRAFAYEYLRRAGRQARAILHKDGPHSKPKSFYVRFIKPEGGEVLSDEEERCKKVRNHEDKISAQRHTFIIMHADISYYSETSIKRTPSPVLK